IDQPLPPYLADQPQPTWSAPLYGAEVKSSIRIDANSELFVTQKVSGMMQVWGLTNKGLVLVDTASGQSKWQKNPADLNASVIEAHAVGSDIIVVGTELETFLPRIVAVDRDSGNMVWQFTASGSDRVTQQLLTDDRLQIVQSNTNEAKIDLWAVDTASGQQLWQRSVERPRQGEDYTDYSLLKIGDSVLLITDSISALNPRSGQSLWQLQAGSLDIESLQTQQLGQQLILHDGRKLLALDPAQGKLSWQYNATDGDIVAPVNLDGSLYLIERKDKLQKIRKLKQNKRGSALVASIADARSPIRLHNNRAYYSTADELVTMNLGNGRVIARLPLPAYLGAADSLADVIAFVGNNVIVARENGVVAFDRNSGQQRYSQAVHHGLGYNYAYLDHKLRMRYLARSGNNWNPGAVVSGISQANIDMLYSMSTGTNEATARSMGYSVGGSSMMLAQSTALLGSTLSMAQSFRDYAVSENLAINQQQMAAAIRSQQASVQHGYYVRPFYYRGWGVTLVRLTDGKRADFIHSRPIEPVRVNQDSLPMFIIDPRRQRLIVKGIGMNPVNSGSYEKVGIGYDVYKSWPGIPNTWIIPNLSLLAYDLADLDFTNNSPFAEAERQPQAGPREMLLREAISSHDIDQVRGLLQQGADVTAVDEFGMDAFIYAGIFDNKEMVQLLIDNGADTTFRDPHGWMAYHYTFMTHPLNQTTVMIRDANLKQSGN
ncbi:MAG: PQQ-binding-like beta-propeller repeat protein, partial [Gammaproteobacteria bacterium]|nr:PQQ-binding-like beta-propeller repeat protein [Gammaproteobacteria bacterium]